MVTKNIALIMRCISNLITVFCFVIALKFAPAPYDLVLYGCAAVWIVILLVELFAKRKGQ